MISNIDNLLSDQNAQSVASYIVSRFASAVPNKNREKEFIDYEFDLNKDGQMVSNAINTEYKMDAEDNTILSNIIDIFYHDDESRLPTEEEFKKLDIFVARVLTCLKKEHKNYLRDAIRNNILGGAAEEVFPLQEINIKEIELSNPLFPYVVKVLKGVSVDDMEQGSGTTQIANELIDEHLETGKDFELILAEKKASLDPKYRKIFGVDLKKEFYQCNLRLWVDYTALKPENII